MLSKLLLSVIRPREMILRGDHITIYLEPDVVDVFDEHSHHENLLSIRQLWDMHHSVGLGGIGSLNGSQESLRIDD